LLNHPEQGGRIITSISLIWVVDIEVLFVEPIVDMFTKVRVAWHIAIESNLNFLSASRTDCPIAIAMCHYNRQALVKDSHLHIFMLICVPKIYMLMIKDMH
jgi:hypothetical protein